MADPVIPPVIPDIKREWELLPPSQQIHILAKTMAKSLYRQAQGTKLSVEQARRAMKGVAVDVIGLYIDKEIENARTRSR